MAKTVSVDTSKFGKGLFSKRPFRPGDVIFTFTGKKINFLDTIRLGEIESYPIQIEKDLYLHPDEPYCFINHSCDPNCGINDNLELVAIKNIQTGEELFFDYSTSMLERHWEMDCLCNTSKCRKVIKDFDFLPHETRIKYISLNIVQPFIKQSLNDSCG
ncbi:MAG: SET domain-containing protein-lysine N-methyltransferase [Spirochaetaceae bacterium]|nr:MAG: SET domain-containing protein-lysine N-methyltransferase [Spirochaetaceae bacterium]